MQECMWIPDGKEDKKKVYFSKERETTLSDSEYKYLLEKPNCQFKFLVDEGSLLVSDVVKADEPKPLSKKEKKKLAMQQKQEAIKKTAEDSKARQGE